jgi:hypothetical protein
MTVRDYKVRNKFDAIAIRNLKPKCEWIWQGAFKLGLQTDAEGRRFEHFCQHLLSFILFD